VDPESLIVVLAVVEAVQAVFLALIYVITKGQRGSGGG
jgi:Na+-translocating ferredoxin:NAD+ oxidoreductase RnfG subunit